MAAAELNICDQRSNTYENVVISLILEPISLKNSLNLANETIFDRFELKQTQDSFVGEIGL